MGFNSPTSSGSSSVTGEVSLTDGSANDLTLQTAGADASSNTSTRVPTYSRISGFNGTTWDRLRAGLLGVQTAATGFLNVLGMMRYNATPPSLSDTNLINFQCDAAGNLKINPGVLAGTVTQTPISVLVTDTSVLSANSNRCALTIQNQDGANPIFIEFSATAALADNNCYKLAAGQTFNAIEHLGYIPTGAVRAISTGGTVLTHVIEATA